MPNIEPENPNIGMDEELRRDYGSYGYRETPPKESTRPNIGVDEENRRENERK
jgi:hypothetical protein